METAPRGDNPFTGIALVLVAYFCFSCIDSGVKWLTLAGLPAMQLSFMRYAGHFAISGTRLLTGGVSGSTLRPEKLGWVVIRAALLAASTVCNFLALKTLSLTLTSTILFLAPVIVCALSWPLLGEKVGPYRGFAVVLGFIGILIAIRPFDESFDPGIFYSLTGTVCFAFYTILTRTLSGTVSTEAMQFYSGLVGTLAFLPAALLVWQSPVDGTGWWVLILIGFFGWAGHELLTRAYSKTEASNLVPFGYVFIIYLGLWSWFLFDQVPDIWNIWGAVIVTIAGLIIWIREIHRSRRKSA